MLLSTCVDFSSGLDHWPPDVKESHIVKSIDTPGLFGQESRTLNTTPTATGRIRQVKANGARSRDSSSGQKARGSSIYFGQGDLVEIRAAYTERLTSISAVL